MKLRHATVASGFFAALLLAALDPVAAAPFTHADYSVSLSMVQTPNQPQSNAGYASDEQESFDPQPATSQVNGTLDTGVTNEFGWATGIATAVASPGVLRAIAQTEAQANGRPDSNVGAGVVAIAVAEFADALTFTPAHPVADDLLIVNGELVLTGDMDSQSYSAGSGYTEVRVGGTGLNPQSTSAEWVGEPTRQKSAAGVYSDWIPGDPVHIPFSFVVYADQPSEIHYWMRVYSSSGASFDACEATGGLCNVAEVASNNATSDWNHTLHWYATEVTTFSGNPVATSIDSSSGFDYEVPEPGATAATLVAVAALASIARRKG